MLSKTHSKYIQSLHHKKFRDEENAFIAEGDKIVKELLQSKKIVCKEIVASNTWLQNNQVLLQSLGSITINEVADRDLEKISALATHSQVVAIFNRTQEQNVSLKNNLVLVLDTIQDPGNLGTIIRIADWFGVKDMVCSNECADRYNPKVIQSSMGSIARVNVVYTDLSKWLNKMSSKNVYAASLNGKPLRQFKNINEGVIIIGNEGKGISKEVMQFCNDIITISSYGGAESLNAAVATGIILSHIR